jgi:hypothetical protein
MSKGGVPDFPHISPVISPNFTSLTRDRLASWLTG